MLQFPVFPSLKSPRPGDLSIMVLTREFQDLRITNCVSEGAPAQKHCLSKGVYRVCFLQDQTVAAMNVLFFLFCGGCTTLLSSVLLSKKKHQQKIINSSFFLESAYNALLVFILCYLFFFSTDRMHIFTDSGTFPQFVFGKTALLFSAVLSVFLGILQAGLSGKPVSEKKKVSFFPVHLILNILLVVLLIFTFAYFWSIKPIRTLLWKC